MLLQKRKRKRIEHSKFTLQISYTVFRVHDEIQSQSPIQTNRNAHSAEDAYSIGIDI